MNTGFRDYFLAVTKASDCQEVEVIQSLWSGYGTISRFKLLGSEFNSVVVKHIDLNNAKNHPRGWNTDIGHQRKVRSYEVEIEWYKNFNKHCDGDCRTAQFMGSFTDADEHWIILEDLDGRFPVRKQEARPMEVKACLRWLAHFHATFLHTEPAGLWHTGTYWHLATRPEEFENIGHQQLKASAAQIDALLNGCQFQTIVHGDAKLANFCFSEDGHSVAAVDFQYVGGGCGMKDVAYFLGSCMTSSELDKHAIGLLNFYFAELENAIFNTGNELEFSVLEQEWRDLFPVAWTDFTRFLLGWMPSHQKVNGYSLKLMNNVLAELDQ